jgi:hypothetical protein
MLMLYRVSLESGADEAIEEVDCEDWAAVHTALDKWHRAAITGVVCGSSKISSQPT